MLIKPEDLKIGDEILVPCLLTFKKLRIKRLPLKDKNGKWKSCTMEIYNSRLNSTWAHYDCTKNEYNDTFRFQFDRDMYLINRIN